MVIHEKGISLSYKVFAYQICLQSGFSYQDMANTKSVTYPQTHTYTEWPVWLIKLETIPSFWLIDIPQIYMALVKASNLFKDIQLVGLSYSRAKKRNHSIKCCENRGYEAFLADPGAIMQSTCFGMHDRICQHCRETGLIKLPLNNYMGIFFFSNAGACPRPSVP